jgi:hypothetical protein
MRRIGGTFIKKIKVAKQPCPNPPPHTLLNYNYLKKNPQDRGAFKIQDFFL